MELPELLDAYLVWKLIINEKLSDQNGDYNPNVTSKHLLQLHGAQKKK